jgi:hypothetical protein
MHRRFHDRESNRYIQHIIVARVDYRRSSDRRLRSNSVDNLETPGQNSGLTVRLCSEISVNDFEGQHHESPDYHSRHTVLRCCSRSSRRHSNRSVIHDIPQRPLALYSASTNLPWPYVAALDQLPLTIKLVSGRIHCHQRTGTRWRFGWIYSERDIHPSLNDELPILKNYHKLKSALEDVTFQSTDGTILAG